MQLLFVDTKCKKMYVFLDNDLIKVFDIVIGKNGVCDSDLKKEGDMKSPRGLFNLGISFGKYDLSIKYPYIKIDDKCYFVDDINSKYYNNFISLNKINTYNYSYIFNIDKKDYNNCEHLIELYDYAVFIEYNINPIIKGKGSCLFIHSTDKNYTYGCIGLSGKDMIWLMNFIDISKNPKILIV